MASHSFGRQGISFTFIFIFLSCSMPPGAVPDCRPTIPNNLYHACMAPVSVSAVYVNGSFCKCSTILSLR